MELFASGDNPAIVFCDGACSGNPGKGGWGAIVVRPDGRVRELGGPAAQTTNNQMEMTAALRALECLSDLKTDVIVYTDSVYVIRGITQWIWGWRQRGWKTAEGNDVANQELWQQLLVAVTRRGREHKLDWRYVRGHTGVPGNERVDEIAVAFTKGLRVKLYDGPLLEYGVAVHDLPADTSVPEPKERPKGQEKKAAAYSYLSVVDGVPQRHSTWAECERRVKGRPGARFKKAMTEADEATILGGWGYSVRDLKR